MTTVNILRLWFWFWMLVPQISPPPFPKPSQPTYTTQLQRSGVGHGMRSETASGSLSNPPSRTSPVIRISPISPCGGRPVLSAPSPPPLGSSIYTWMTIVLQTTPSRPLLLMALLMKLGVAKLTPRFQQCSTLVIPGWKNSWVKSIIEGVQVGWMLINSGI